MANRMGTPGRGKDFGWLPEQEEESLRRIYEVEDSERNFIERNLNLEDAIDFIREGVGFEVARSLEEDFEHYGEEKNSLRLLNILKI